MYSKVTQFIKKHQQIAIAGLALIIIPLSMLFSAGKAAGFPSWHDVFEVFFIHDPLYGAQNYPMSVHIIDVGKADSIYICSEGKNVLIDAGERDIYPTVNQYLQRLGVTRLDLVVATHPHSDHIGGMSEVIDAFTVERVIMPWLPANILPPSESYDAMMHSLSAKSLTVECPKTGTHIELGGMDIHILAPVRNDYDTVNDYSVVLKVTYGNKSFMLTGDAETVSEDDMIKAGYDLHADVLKVGHHGSKTSTGQAFLSAVNPKYAAISVNDDRSKLPKKDTMNRLKSNNIDSFRTDLHGTIVFATNGEDLSIFTEKG